VKICPLEAELRTEGHKDGRDEANSHSS